eukprot:TRINITY_DN1810_c0_g3_i3.p1 TRINITY_DN1810_c0_g3~~TRINITY_DN1810_c0_g3_i3.p1  ORF type:complete len:137 (+),score=9.24 TRINITY_DN1810_c0_g3_i3:983-1393(+)
MVGGVLGIGFDNHGNFFHHSANGKTPAVCIRGPAKKGYLYLDHREYELDPEWYQVQVDLTFKERIATVELSMNTKGKTIQMRKSNILFPKTVNFGIAGSCGHQHSEHRFKGLNISIQNGEDKLRIALNDESSEIYT